MKGKLQANLALFTCFRKLELEKQVNRKYIAAMMLLASCHSSFSATGTINFSGNVAATCSLNVTGASGVMMPSSSLQVVSSKNAGGSPGVVAVTSTGGVVLSVDAVTTSTHPAADITPTAWVPTYSLSGMQTVPDTATSTAISASGTGTMNVHLTGTKTGASSFVTGPYTAVVTVRCEP